MKKVFWVILGIVVFVIVLGVGVGVGISAPKYEGEVSTHFNGKTFFTPAGETAKGLWEVLKWQTSSKKEPWISAEKPPNYGEAPPARVEGSSLRITFVNHSTFLIQTQGLTILTDPVWSKRTSPFSWAGPARLRPPGIRYEDLPEKIDAVILSHNHYDHLDIPTLKRLQQSHDPLIVTPLGIEAYLKSEGFERTKDLDWWESIQLSSGVNLRCVPAQHFSGRGLLDRDATLWAGFTIETVEDGNVYFAGDTGYHPELFKEIGERCAPVRLALIPIGAYKPEWFMSPVHVSPVEAVKIHRDVKAAHSLGMHFGTFQLADEGRLTPLQDLESAKVSLAVPASKFTTIQEGEAVEF